MAKNIRLYLLSSIVGASIRVFTCFFFQALSFDVPSANEHTATRPTFALTFGRGTRVSGSPVLTARGPSPATTRFEGTCSESTGTFRAGFRPSSTRPGSCQTRSGRLPPRPPSLPSRRRPGVEARATTERVRPSTEDETHHPRWAFQIGKHEQQQQQQTNKQPSKIIKG
jgi:hypothetical protein